MPDVVIEWVPGAVVRMVATDAGLAVHVGVRHAAIQHPGSADR